MRHRDHSEVARRLGPAAAARRQRRARLGYALIVSTAVALFGAGVHVARVHHDYWEWRWAPTASPPKITFEGRDYRRDDGYDPIEPGNVAIERTAAGQSTIYGPRDRRYAPVGLWLHTRKGRWVSYGLLGGP